MSRLGKRPVLVPAGVTVSIDEARVTATGPKGTSSLPIPPYARVAAEDTTLIVSMGGGGKQAKALHGLAVRLLGNLLTGVSAGYTRTLEVQGVGYRAAMQGPTLVLNVGFSHPVTFAAPEGVTVSVAKNTITVSGIDKQLVGQAAATIRRVRPPEPYKGKGIRYTDEHVQRKAGKAAKAAGAAA
ncbi:50S ribosomal protein L6 [Candidatus Berkelbacteria bacterium]|nr:50S ribosomal protein L6 [Candidatus Berkelbacteria bacterium]